jgi:hypothetical protein
VLDIRDQADVLEQAGVWVHAHRSAAAGVRLDHSLRGELSRVDPGGGSALRLRGRLAAEADYRAGTSERILAVVAEARAAGDPVALAENLGLALHCLLGPGSAAARQPLTDELISAALRSDRPGDLALALLWRAVDGYLVGDPLAERRRNELRAHLDAEPYAAAGLVADGIDVMRDIRAGRLAEAEIRAGTNATAGRSAGDPNADGWYAAQLVTVRWYQGRLAELRPLLTDVVDSPALSVLNHSFVAALAVAAADAGDRRTSIGALARLRDTALADSNSRLVTLYGMVEAAHRLADADAAADAYQRLAPHAAMPMTGGLAVTCFGSTEHALGVAALTTGDLDRAIEHLHAAVRDNERLGHWPAAALARARLAASLVRRGGPGDAASARRLRAAADEDADAFGLVLPAPAISARPVRVEAARRGRFWEIGYAGRLARVADGVGVRYLATLLANAGAEMSASDLAGAPTASIDQPVLDAAARQAYRRRLSDLQDEIDDLEAAQDLGRAEAVRAEREWLIAELAAATGLGGRTRRFAGPDERARISVTKAIRRAVARITTADPVIGAELDATVRTGARCLYAPR